MKAITIIQPWASLWALDLKRYETRGWETLLRGRFAIHASQDPQLNLTPEQRDAVRRAFNWPEGDITAEIKNLPKGAFIAVADLAECYKIVRWSEGLGLEGRLLKNTDGTPQRDDRGRRIPWGERPYPEGDELLFGDFREGRYAWAKENTILLPKPLPCRGNQRLWEVPDENIEAALMEATT
jgi:hypothetical protein